MAVLTGLPNQNIIDGFAGTVDFYLYMGIPVARKWPRYSKRDPYPDEIANQTDFAYINTLAKSLPPIFIAGAKEMAVGTTLTWKDVIVKAFMSGIPM